MRQLTAYILGLLLLTISCRQVDPSDNVLDKMKAGDTLTIETYLSDCGEWGGHKEYITIYLKNRDHWANFKSIWTICEGDSIKRGKDIEESLMLSADHKETITKYIDIAIKNNGMDKGFDNAANIYSIHFKDSTIKIVMGDKWYEYQKVVDKLLY